MRHACFSLPALLILATIAVSARETSGQVAHWHVRAFAANVIVPQSRILAVDRSQKVEVTDVQVGVVIVEQVATTSMDISVRNPSGVRLEAELLVPVPEGAAVRGFTFQGAGKEPSAELLPKAEATATYKAIVAKLRDPALLEFAAYNLIRSSVFPVDPHGTQKVRLTYEHLLPADVNRVDYILPRTEAIDYRVPWRVSVKIKTARPVSTVYSPSHKIQLTRQAKNAVTVEITKEAMGEPGPVQLSYLRESAEGVSASLVAYPDPKIDGGYFLLLAGLPAKATDADGRPAVKREVTLVVDRSGSMAGDKLNQVKAAATQILDGLLDGEAFNIIDYSDSIASFASAPVVRDKRNVEEARHYVRRLSAGGGTNIHDALLESLRPQPKAGLLPLMLFLTDGLPTVGVRDELSIRTAAQKGNSYKRRIFTFGVGYDVNAPLLSHLAQNSRAASTFVLPREEIEAKVSQVYRCLSGPVLAEPTLKVIAADGAVDTRRVKDPLPAVLPDLFEGDQLVVLGKYHGAQPLEFRLQGDFRGAAKTFKFQFKLDGATTKNNFVPRLWASRKIAWLVDEIRQAGAGTAPGTSVLSARPASDPKMKELVDEIVRLSVEFGILTEYTAFLAKEGSDLSQREQIIREANDNLIRRAQVARSGIGAVNQAMNANFQQSQMVQNRRNEFYDQNMNRVQVSRVQQINDRAFFQQGRRWVDGSALDGRAPAQPDRTIVAGSPEFFRLLERLTAENRPGVLSMSGEILLRVDGQNVLIRGE